VTVAVTRLPATVAPERMAQLVTDLGLVGERPGGMVRFTYDDAWARAADLVERWMRDIGLAVRRDAVGNVLGRAEGTDSPRTVLTGSHLDTVLLGGKYDGALGVVAAIAAVELLLTHCGRPSRSLEVVALCEEEGSRYHSNFLGSRAMLGQLERSELDSLRDADGVTLADAMRHVGLDPDAVASARRDDVDAFLELHIEQGRTLHDEGTQIGVVEAITALDWLEVTVRGQADHAGTTPMHARRDAMQAAAAMTTAITGLVERAGHPAVVTCGRWEVEPGGTNIVPGRVRFSVDLRHPDEGVLADLGRGVAAACREVADARGVAVTVERAKYAPPAPMDAGLRERIAEAARVCGASWRDLPSGAGHDSQMWAPHVPTGMIFVPSVDGRSHCPEEYTSPEDAARGATVLATVLHSLAYAAA
jgi:allantoate deiminase